MPFPALAACGAARGAPALRARLPSTLASPSYTWRRQLSGASAAWSSSSSEANGGKQTAGVSRATAPGSAPGAKGGGVDYSSTICLPQTTMDMRANAATREPLIHRLWDGLYEWQATRESALPAFILHDGPPFANGKPHMGHFLNKTLKDITCRFRVMRGHRVSHIPGWDCHGLPIEQKALESFKVKEHQSISPVDIRSKCKQFAEGTIVQQAEAFRRWGVLADWKNPYLTMKPEYEAAQLSVFYKMYATGQIHRGYKPVFWSPSSQTALAEAELEYHDHVSKSIYIRFPLRPSQHLRTRLTPLLDKHSISPESLSCLVWTTTPWTIPANQALAVNPKLTYALVRIAETSEALIVAQELVASVSAKLKANLETITTFSGHDLLDSTYSHPLFDRCERMKLKI